MSDAPVTKPKRKAAGRYKLPPGPGRPKGSVNRITREFRQTVRALLEDNADNVALWLAEVANGSRGRQPDPAKALDLLVRLAEFAAPKLGRIEHTGAGGGPLAQVTLDVSHLSMDQLQLLASIRLPEDPP